MERRGCQCIDSFFFLRCCLPVRVAPRTNISFRRNYVEGETARYRLSRHYYTNGILQNEAVARATLAVESVNGFLAERVRWESLKIEDKQGWQDHSDIAKSVKPFLVSLAPEWPMEIPALEVPLMTGMVTDFITFWVSVSPSIGTTRVRNVGSRFTSEELSIGKWADGKDVLVGEDCISTTVELLELTSSVAEYRSSFDPPQGQCLTMRESWMKKQVVAETHNNFQQIRVSNGRYTAMWGLEKFRVESRVDRQTGRVLNATMSNALILKLKGDCDAELDGCKYETPIRIRRELVLSLIE